MPINDYPTLAFKYELSLYFYAGLSGSSGKSNIFDYSYLKNYFFDQRSLPKANPKKLLVLSRPEEDSITILNNLIKPMGAYVYDR